MVTFKYSSFYEDESENKVAEDTLEYEAKDLDELWTILGDEDYNDDIVMNYEAKSHCTNTCLLYTSPSPRDRQKSRMPSSA